MGASTRDFLCKVMDIAERSAAFFADAAKGCGRLGSEMFSEFSSAAKRQAARLAKLKAALDAGTPFEAACSLPEEEARDLAATFRDLAARHTLPKACATELGAAAAGLELLRAALRFSEEWAGRAEDQRERGFAAGLVAEQRGQMLALADLERYYEDPEGFALAKGRGGLDGA
jgi:hypothetical protein